MIHVNRTLATFNRMPFMGQEAPAVPAPAAATVPQATCPPGFMVPLLALGVVALAATEIFGVTNILGLRK
jgi:hypothetical protein